MKPRISPAITTEVAARRLPRWALAGLFICYFLLGIWSREAWRPWESDAFAFIHAMGTETLSGLVSDLSQKSPLLPAWLPYWASALSVWIVHATHATIVPPEWAARIPVLLALGLSLWKVWQTTRLLALTPAAQPIPMAFGGQASPSAYSNALADASLLAMVATLGMALMSHEIGVSAWQLLSSAWLFHNISTWLLSAQPQALTQDPQRLGRLSSRTVSWMVGSLLAFLSGVWWLSLLAWVVWLAACLIQRRFQQWPILMGAAIWLLLLGATLSVVQSYTFISTSWQTNDWRGWFKLLGWYLWPSWLLVIWALWSWRKLWNQTHVLLPALFALAIVIISSFSNRPERVLMMALPVVAMLGVFALPTLKKSITGLMDWFALVFFTGGAVIIWGVWLSLMTGIPAKPAQNVYRLVPDFVAVFHLPTLLIALLVTLAWLGVIGWRLARHRPALWKSLTLSASGTTLCWVLLMTLWLPMLNEGLGYASTAKKAGSFLHRQYASCVTVTTQMDASRLQALKRHNPQISWHLQDAISADVSRPVNCEWHLNLSTQATAETLPGYLHQERLIQASHRREFIDLYKR